MSSITIEEFDSVCENLFLQKEKYEKLSEELKEENKKLENLKAQVLAHLKECDKSSYQVKDKKISVTSRFSVRIPQGEELQLFKHWSKDNGVEEVVFKVNSQSLNSWYKAFIEEHTSVGNLPPVVDGLGLPTTSETISIRKA